MPGLQKLFRGTPKNVAYGLRAGRALSRRFLPRRYRKHRLGQANTRSAPTAASGSGFQSLRSYIDLAVLDFDVESVDRLMLA